MTDVEKLLIFEEIRALKARYCRLLDDKQWTDWGLLFAADGVMVRQGPD